MKNPRSHYISSIFVFIQWCNGCSSYMYPLCLLLKYLFCIFSTLCTPVIYFFQQDLVFLWKIIHCVKDKEVIFFSVVQRPISFQEAAKCLEALINFGVPKSGEKNSLSNCTHYTSLVNLYMWIFLSMKTNGQTKKVRTLDPYWIQKPYLYSFLWRFKNEWDPWTALLNKAFWLKLKRLWTSMD